MDAGDSFFGLRRYSKGKIGHYELMDTDSSISRVVPSPNLGQSKIYLDFEDFQKFGKILGLNDDDIWFESAVNSPYNGFELYDTYTVEEDFKQGYGPWYDLDEENLDLLKQITKLIYGKKIDFDDEDDKGELVKFLDKYYSREIDEICNDWAYEKNTEFNYVASKHVNDEINNYLGEFGMERVGDGIKTTVADLISLYLQYGVPHLSLKELLKHVFEKSPTNIGGWDEDRYEYQDDEIFDKDSFNRSANRVLEKILEKIDEDFEGDEGLNFKNMIDRVTKKNKIGLWYSTPKDSNLLYRIDGFDKDTKKIDISLKTNKVFPSGIKKFKVSEDAFNKILYQPELFNLVDF